MQGQAHDVSDERSARPRSITVTLNKQAVVLDDRRMTGAAIKAAAIAQGVAIQQDFVLFEVKPSGHLKQIGDQEEVTLQEGDTLQAIAPDDNS